MKLTLTTHSFVHIGSGREITPMEYLLDRGTFHRLHMDGLFQDEDFKPESRAFDDFMSLAGKAKPEARHLGGHKELEAIARRHILYTLPVDQTARQEPDRITVSEAFRSAGKTVVPGSSIKGALLGVVAYGLLKTGRIQWPANDRELRDRVAAWLGGKPERDGSLRWLDVSDTDGRPADKTLALAIVRVERSPDARPGKGPLKAAHTLMEVIKPGVTFNLDIKVPRSVRGDFFESMLAWAREYAQEICRAEGEPMHVSAQSGPIRLGQGSGAWAMSLLAAAKALGRKEYSVSRLGGFHNITCADPPWTRKKAGVRPLGWAYLKPAAS
ncbi:MAG: RAMP superfamily CRISPR-associated protein [Elusimicrobiota bacterium]